ncbi:MAG: MMPL family transporter [Gammaproteobacteria bacterium]|nr:MAG: MMPL family transporter [Gammaproteobacteria bacterium]
MTEAAAVTDRIALRLADFVVRRRWLVILATLALVVLAGSGGRYLEFSNNYRVFFSPDNPELVAFEEFQRTYTKNDNILFVLQPTEASVFVPRIADAIERLTREAWQIPFATRVDSVSNFQHSRADGDELIVDDLYRDGVSLSPSTLEERQRIALDEPILNGQLISPDAGTTGINVTLNFPEKSLTELPEAIAAARTLAAQIESDYPGVTVAITGISALNNAFAAAGQADAMTLIPAMYLVLILVTLIVLRSFYAMLATIMVIAFSTVTAVGLAGYMGIALDPISMTATIVILTLAIADSVHILVSMLDAMRDGKDRISSLKDSLRINFLAVTVTSITTIVGFMSLNFSDSPPFWYLGNITAMGIAAAWLYSLTFLPALLSVLPIKVGASKRQRGSSSPLMVRFARFVTARHRAVLLVSTAIAVTLISFVPKVELNDEWVKYFDHRIEFRGDAEFAMDNLTGLYLLEYSIPARDAGGISEPEYLQNLDEFTGWLRALPEVRHVYSYTDVVKRLNKNMHGDNEAWYRLTDSRNLAAQYLLLYELSLPYGLDLNDRINVDKSATRVTVTVEEISTAGVREFLARSGDWLEANTPEYMWTTPTGATVMFSYISERNIKGMLGGNLVAVAGIALILILSLRSLSLGTLSLIPNLVPILMTFGAWGILVGQVGMGAATVSATSLGIVVDNTVHFLTKYLRARRELNANRPLAIEYAFKTVGWAIAANAVIMMFGFAVLATSSFKVNVEMGLLTAMAILIALVVDFFLLPALLMVGYRKEESDYEQDFVSETV